MKKATLSLFDHLLMYSPSSTKRKTFRSTQIMATIPEGSTKDDILGMIGAGMNIARFDGSQGKQGLNVIEGLLGELREAVSEYNEKRRKDFEKKSLQANMGDECDVKSDQNPNVHVATAFDLKGIFYETGTFPADVTINAGETIDLTTNTEFIDKCSDKLIYVNYPNLLVLQPNQVIIVDQKIKLVVTSVDEEAKTVSCRIDKGGEVLSGGPMEVNIPGVKNCLMSVTEDTIPAINFCKQHEMDMLIAPINDPSAFKMIKCSVNPEGAAKCLKVIAKLEGADAVRNFDKIVEHADGVMISRGRLGRNMSPEQAIVLQKTIISKCLKAGVPSMVASDMLKSMEDGNSDGTRAEISDIANAVLDGTDCTMLEGDVSTKNAIQTMSSTIMEAEDMINYRRWYIDLITQASVPPAPLCSFDFTDSIAMSACTAAMVTGASAIIALTDTGRSIRLIAKYRPECPIISVARTPDVARQVLMVRGVFSISVDDPKSGNYPKSVDPRILAGIAFIKTLCLIKKYPGVVVAMMAGHKEGKPDTIRIIPVLKDKKTGDEPLKEPKQAMTQEESQDED